MEEKKSEIFENLKDRRRQQGIRMQTKNMYTMALLLSLTALSLTGCGVSKAIQNPIDNGHATTYPVTLDVTSSVADDSAQMVARNNEIRAELYQGNPIVWSESLAISAQAYADKLAETDSFEHSNTSNGENLYADGASTGYVDAIKLWYSEKADYNLDTKSCNPGAICGHYTQLIWKDTTEVGCGKSSSNTWKTIIVCQYNPPGNYIGEPAF